MIEYFNSWADRRAVTALEARDLGRLKVRERITLGVRLRIRAQRPLSRGGPPRPRPSQRADQT